jgi:replication factor C subunit 3/5
MQLSNDIFDESSDSCFTENSDNYSTNDQNLSLKDILPWTEKYRPANFNDIISHEHIINTLRNFIKNKCVPHLLFYGPPGTGKTSTITVCAKELYGKYYGFMVMELNASDDRGIEVVRNRIKKFVAAQGVFFGSNAEERKNIFKLVILDETDAMTGDAQAILRKVVEEYTANTRFCLICNYIQKIIPALQSRCTRFRFSPLIDSKVRKMIIQVGKLENIQITKSGLETIIKRSRGDMRKVLNILQSTNMAYDVINEKNVNNCVGCPQKAHMKKIINLLIDDSFKDAYNKINKLKITHSLSLCDIISELHDILFDHILGNNNNIIITKDQSSTILDKLREIEFNKSVISTDDIQLSAVVGIFKMALFVNNKN